MRKHEGFKEERHRHARRYIIVHASLRHLTAMRDVDVLPRNGAVAVLLHEQLVLFPYLRLEHGNIIHERGERAPSVGRIRATAKSLIGDFSRSNNTPPLGKYMMNVTPTDAPVTLRAKRGT